MTEEEKVCSETGQPLVKIGEEVTRKLVHKPGSYFIKEIVRPKYAFPKNSEGGIRIAPLPESPLNRCQADESLLADVLVKMFCDHLPFIEKIKIITFVPHSEHIRRILRGIGWPTELPEFYPPYELFTDNICQLVPNTQDGFPEPEVQVRYDAGPDPPLIADIDLPHYDDILDPPHWED